MGPSLHFLEMNDSSVEVDVHRYCYLREIACEKAYSSSLFVVELDNWTL
jgi:hypothetical protein